jgi:hypothetical protein
MKFLLTSPLAFFAAFALIQSGPLKNLGMVSQEAQA